MTHHRIELSESQGESRPNRLDEGRGVVRGDRRYGHRQTSKGPVTPCPSKGELPSRVA